MATIDEIDAKRAVRGLSPIREVVAEEEAAIEVQPSIEDNQNLDQVYTQSRTRAPDALDRARARIAARKVKAEEAAREQALEDRSIFETFAISAGQLAFFGPREGLRQQSRAIEGLLDRLDIPSFLMLTDAEGNFDLDLLTRAEVEERDLSIFSLFPETEKPEGFAPNLARSTGQFLAGFIGPFKALKRSGVGSTKAAFGAGAVADAFAFDPKEPTASEFLETTGLANPITEFLATDPDDSEAEQRFKNAIEGGILGKVGEVLTRGVIKAFNAVRSSKSITEETAEAVTKEAEEGVDALARIEEKVGSGETVVITGPTFNRNIEGTSLKTDLKEIKGATGEGFIASAPNGSGGTITLDIALVGKDKGQVTFVANELRSRETAGGRVTQLYADAVDELAKDGRRLVSDTSVTDKAARIWGRLESLGFKIKKNPNTIRREGISPRTVSTDGSPIFEVIKKPKVVAKLTDEELESVAFEGIIDSIAPQKAVNINLQKLNTPDDVKNVIAQVGKAFEGDIQAARRGKIALEQTERLADELGMSAEDLLQRQQGQAFNAETVVAARKILVASAEKVRDLAKTAIGTDVTPEDKAAFLRAMSVHKGIQAQVSGLTAEAGRALSAFRISAGRDINVSLENVPVEDMARAVASQDTLIGLNQVTRNLDKATTGDMFLEMWINSLLSGPKTQAVNIISNAMVNLWSIPQRFLASGFGKVLPGNQEIAMGETVQMLYGLKEGYRDGLKLAWKALKTGEVEDPLTKLDVGRRRAIPGETLDFTGIGGRAADFLQESFKDPIQGLLNIGKLPKRFGGEVIRLPGRALEVGDQLFKSVNGRMELNALAFRQARQEGLEGRAMAKRMVDLVNDPPANIVDEAVQFSRVQTFTNELGESSRLIQNLANSHPAIKMILPFVRTPVNIVKMVGVNSPLAPFAKSVREDIASGGSRRDLALAKISTGSMMMITAFSMAGEGRITGSGPANPNLKKILRNTGWEPYSIVFGDLNEPTSLTYVSYSRLDPIGMTIGIAADYAEISGNSSEADLLDIASAAALSTAKNLTSKTYLRGLTTFLGAIDQSSADPEKENRAARRFIERLVVSAVPFSSLQAQTARVIDPTLRDTDGLLQSLKSRTVGYSADLPATLNMWGEEIILAGGLGPDIISPIYISHGKEAPVSLEMWKQRLPIGMPSRSIQGVRMTSQEYHDFIKLTTKLDVKNELDEIIKTRGYKRLTDGPEGEKASVIRSIINESREFAREEILFGNDPEFRDLRQRIREAQ